MERLGINQAIAFDRDFRVYVRFEILLRIPTRSRIRGTSTERRNQLREAAGIVRSRSMPQIGLLSTTLHKVLHYVLM